MATYVFETMTAAAASSYDPSRDQVVFANSQRPDEISFARGNDTIPGPRRSEPASRKAPDTSPHGQERLRQAALRRVRKAERQKKGMTRG